MVKLIAQAADLELNSLTNREQRITIHQWFSIMVPEHIFVSKVSFSVSYQIIPNLIFELLVLVTWHLLMENSSLVILDVSQFFYSQSVCRRLKKG
jgi:hypothetical protein